LIAVAAVVHVALTVGLFCAGRAQVAPAAINPDGIMNSFASDGHVYRQGAMRLVGVLRKNGVRAWASQSEKAHVKIISLQFALLGPLFGQSILSAEPFNLLCYLAILSLVFMLGREVGGRGVGLIAAAIVALWPTFLLHTTQFLKDPLFIAGALALVLIVTTWLTRTYSRMSALGMGALMALTTGILLRVRFEFGVMIYAFVCFGFGLLIIRQLLERRLLYWNLVVPLLIIIIGMVAPFYLSNSYDRYSISKISQYSLPVCPGKEKYAAIATEGQTSPTNQTPLGGVPATVDRVAMEVGCVRFYFIAWHLGSGSAIDSQVRIENFKELVLYLPRALEIGLLAPFPKDWFGMGLNVGRAGRLVSGVETLIIYLCELLAILAIVRSPRCLPGWLLLAIAIPGVTALGLIVANIGALYRFRYLFWILFIILGVKGLVSIISALKERNAGRPVRAGVESS
jgi:4-amino-4-deoxy-L-arabinose transferase-like glycosyltransferase